MNYQEFLQLMYSHFTDRIQSVPPAYQSIFQFLAEEKVRSHILVAKWQA